MEDIKYVQLSEIAELITKGTTPTTLGYEFQDEGVKFLKAECFDENGGFIENKAAHISEECHEKLKRSQLKAGDILFSIAGAIGRVAIVSEEMLPANTNQALAIIRISDEQVYLPYIKLILTSPIVIEQFERKKQGVAQLNLSLKDINEISIPLPIKEKQIELAELFAKVVRVISKRSMELSLLDDLIKARFVEMFGIPLDESKANMRFTDCVEFNPKKSEVKDMQNVEVSFIPMECVGVDGSFNIRENGPVSNYYKGYTYFRDGDVLLAKITPCFENGKAAIAEGCKNGIGFGTTEFHVARPKAGVSNSYWIKYLLKNDSVHDLATINMTGSAGQKRIQTSFFEKLIIFCPPIQLQNQFAAFVAEVDKSKVAVQKALDETQTLFDSLMQEYFG